MRPAEQLLARGPRAGLASGAHAVPVRELGGRADRRLAGQPAALLRRAGPGVVPGGRRAASRTSASRSCPTTPRCRSTRRRTRRPGYPAAQRDKPGGFTADPDVHGHLGDLVADARRSRPGGARDDDLFARVFPMDLRPQAHEIIRTWLFYSVLRGAVRGRRAAVAARGDLGLDRGPGPQEDVQVRRERGDAGRPAARVRSGRGAVLGGQRAARRGHRVRPGAAQGGPAAGGQDPEREPVRAGFGEPADGCRADGR